MRLKNDEVIEQNSCSTKREKGQNTHPLFKVAGIKN